MSSPTNVVIQVSTPGFNKDACATVATKCRTAWQASPERLWDGTSYSLTDQLMNEFYNRVVSGQAYSWGMEGDQLIFAFDGDYISHDEVLAEVAVFVRALTESGDHPPYSVSATILAAHEDDYCHAYKISDENGYKPRSFGQLPFGFDKDVGEGEVMEIGDDE